MTCAVCGGPDTRGHIPSPQDAIAASICWLTTSLESSPQPVMERLSKRKRHAKACRYCPMSQKEKMELIVRGRAHERDDQRWKAWNGLSSNQQFARVCEAQESSWVDSLPA